jgi:hypothetical protein
MARRSATLSALHSACHKKRKIGTTICTHRRHVAVPTRFTDPRTSTRAHHRNCPLSAWHARQELVVPVVRAARRRRRPRRRFGRWVPRWPASASTRRQPWHPARGTAPDGLARTRASERAWGGASGKASAAPSVCRPRCYASLLAHGWNVVEKCPWAPLGRSSRRRS